MAKRSLSHSAIPEYRIFRNDIFRYRRVGVAVIVKTEIVAKSEMEELLLEIVFPAQKFLIAGIYKLTVLRNLVTYLKAFLNATQTL